VLARQSETILVYHHTRLAQGRPFQHERTPRAEVITVPRSWAEDIVRGGRQFTA